MGIPLHSRRRALWLVLAGAGLAAAAGAGWRWQREAGPASQTVVPPDDVCVVAPPTPHDPLSGVGLHEARSIPVDARCPVCGMFPARSPQWAAQLIFENGDTQFFDSPLSMFAFLQNVGRYAAGRERAQVARLYVTNAKSGEWLNAQAAVYVDGSNALGPMRAGNLPAFATTEDAQRFADHRGGVLLNFDEVTPQMLDRLGNLRDHRHPL